MNERISGKIKSPEQLLAAQDMGEAAQEMFSGKTHESSVGQLYAETAALFAEVIKNKLPPRDAPYEMLDVGSFKGDLVANVVKEVGDDYHFAITGIDVNGEALEQNQAVSTKVTADISAMPFADRQFDVTEARYVLVWNKPEKQEQILREINRVTSDFSILQHAGADNTDTSAWQHNIHALLSGGVPKLQRQECYFSSADEIEQWMTQNGIQFKRIQHRKVDKVSSVFIEKFKLSEEETRVTHQILGDKDYIYQTTWIIGEAA